MKLSAASSLRAGALMLALAGSLGSAQAQDIFETSGTMIGGAQFASYTFEITDAGADYMASLLDYVFPSSFDVLGLAITQGADMLGSIQGSGSFMFSPLETGTYTALVFGDPGGMFDAGSYGVTVTNLSAAAVPEPQTWALLATGLGLVGIAVRRREPMKAVQAG
ncbi:MAG: FxDxF family PEP-CTERM protein [Pseudomonadota bacterium]